MNILIYSHAPWARSGYGQITYGLACHLKAFGWNVSVAAIGHQNSTLLYNGIQVYPCPSYITNTPGDLYHIATITQPDIILQLFDAWVIGNSWIRPGIPVITYNPVDCSPIAFRMKESLQNATLNIAMSPFTVNAFRQHDITPYKYIPHSIDSLFFKPIPKDSAREACHIPKDAFILGLVGTNLTCRKNIPGQILAFKYFLDNNPEANAYLYLHTNLNKCLDSAYTLPYYIKSLNLNNRVAWVDQKDYKAKLLSDDYMLYFYNSLDVLLGCSYGEGFGIPIIEAQACGVPTIVTNFSAMPFTAGDGGLKVKGGVPVAVPDSNAWQFCPDPHEIAAKIDLLYHNHELRNKLSGYARKNAKTYDWNFWMPVWQSTLETVYRMRH